jgi:hypothetical protein
MMARDEDKVQGTKTMRDNHNDEVGVEVEVR